MKTRQCPQCREKVNIEATFCPHCTQYIPAGDFSDDLGAVAALLPPLIGIVLLIIFVNYLLQRLF